MKELSDRTKTEISRYFKRLVKRQPMWLKILFEADRVAFVIAPTGLLELEVDEELPQETKDKTRIMIARYLNKHPVNFIERRDNYVN
jgi:hypothetical protein